MFEIEQKVRFIHFRYAKVILQYSTGRSSSASAHFATEKAGSSGTYYMVVRG